MGQQISQATRNYKAGVYSGGAFGSRDIISGCVVGGGECGLLKIDPREGNILEKVKRCAGTPNRSRAAGYNNRDK